MAKGNDGNYLQHSVEIEAALQLAKMDPEGRLHIAITHGMAPYEPLDPGKGQVRGRLYDALRASREPPRPGESSIVAAFRETGASAGNYPNSAELLRSVIGKDNLSGGITEVDPEKSAGLAKAWTGSCIVPSCSSWREQTNVGGVLACPDDLQVPWLFSMDPMTYIEGNEGHENQLHQSDSDLLSDTLARYVKSGKPGIAALFVYNVRPDAQSDFWKFVDDLSKRTGTVPRSFWLTHRGGNRNLAALLCSGTKLPSAFAPAGVTARRT